MNQRESKKIEQTWTRNCSSCKSQWSDHGLKKWVKIETFCGFDSSTKKTVTESKKADWKSCEVKVLERESWRMLRNVERE